MAKNPRRDEAKTTPLAYEDADVVAKLSWQAIRFSPLLAVYLLVIVLLPDRIDDVDAGRYLRFAENLTQGFYIPKVDPYGQEAPYLPHGPGYPMYLLPFELLNAPRWIPLIGHAVMSLGAVLFLFNALREYISVRSSTFVCYLAGLYPVYLWYLPVITTEPLAWFLSAAFVWCFVGASKASGFAWRYVIGAGISLGLLALTKMFFGHVIVFIGISFLTAFVIFRDSRLLKGAQIAGLALIVCLPYLAYTYSLTGRVLYWGTNGGAQLYFLASPYAGEYGDWVDPPRMFLTERSHYYEPHRDFIESLRGMSYMERNDAFRHKAIEIIKENPTAYLKNWVASVSRLFFDFPRSFKTESTSPLFFIFFNTLWLVPLLFSILPAFAFRKLIPLEVWMAFGIVTVYLGGVSLVSGTPRNVVPAMPFLTLWLGVFYFRVLNISIRTSEAQQPVSEI
ncbi:MAG: hypothetical protein OEQ39_18260 [Gammaproteobacteria bacterium]|nr:hypothetical protein [Gammaproteobacteria bacterium]